MRQSKLSTMVSLPEIIGLRRWNLKGEGILRTEFVKLLYLKSKMQDRRRNLGIQLLTHDNAQQSSKTETKKITTKIAGCMSLYIIS